MFGFGKNKKGIEQNEQQKKKAKIDKLIMGAIIGVAVGSVVGMAVAPQKGKDTRKMIAEKSKEAFGKGREMSDKFFSSDKKKKGFSLLKSLFGRKTGTIAHMKEIPGETVGNEELKNL
jgi:gas vesicle protein